MPASCDVFVTQLRKWLDKEAGGGPQWAPGVEAAPGSSGAAASAAASEKAATPGSAEERKLVLDRKAQHVRLCTICQRGEKQLQKARNFFIALSFFALLGLATVVGGWLFGGVGGAARGGGGVLSSNSAAALASAGCALVAGLSAKLASNIHWGLLPNFGFRDYVHAHKD